MSCADLVASMAATVVLILCCSGWTASDHATRGACANNMRQLGVALLQFSAENDGQFPSRRPSPNAWPDKLNVYYSSAAVLRCPGDIIIPTTRSYIINGWSDYFAQQNDLSSARGMREADIPLPAGTITFGEKESYSLHLYMDLLNGDDFQETEASRHLKNGSIGSGGSNYAFADGSVRFLKFGAASTPENLWAVVPEVRTNSLIIF